MVIEFMTIITLKNLYVRFESILNVIMKFREYIKHTVEMSIQRLSGIHYGYEDWYYIMGELVLIV